MLNCFFVNTEFSRRLSIQKLDYDAEDCGFKFVFGQPASIDKPVCSALNGYLFRAYSGPLALTALTVTRLREAFAFTTGGDLRGFAAHSLLLSSYHRLDMLLKQELNSV